MFDALLETAVYEDFKQELEKIDWSSEETHIFSPRHKVKMKKLFKKQRHKVVLYRASAAAKKVAVIILVFFSVLFFAIMSVDAIREEVFRAVTEWYEKYADISFQSKADNNTTPDIDLEFEGMKLPKFIPDGYEQGEIASNESTISTVYINPDGLKIFYQQKRMSDGDSISIDNEERSYKEIYINKAQGLLFIPNSDNKFYSLIWHDVVYSYLLRGHIDEKMLILIAESVEYVE